MSAIIKKLKTSENGVEKVVLPITVLEAVVDSDTNQSLNSIVQDLNNKIENTSSGGATYEEATESEAGLMSPQDKVKLNSVEAGANNYTHPTSDVMPGTYKSVTVDEEGHVTSGTNPTTLDGYGITDAEVKGTASSAISAHDTSTFAHNDIRELITGLTTRLNALADSDDTTLDQMSEIVAYIKSNKTLIESITTNKVNVSDIVDNLTTNVSDKPLSAAQGVAIKNLIDALQTAVNGKANTSNLTSHTDNKSNPHSVTKSQVGLGNVENKSSETIRGELTKANVTNALGYTPPTTDTIYGVVSTTADGLAPKRDGSTSKFLRGDGTWATPPDTNTTYNAATTSASGLMTADMVTKLNGIATGAQVNSITGVKGNAETSYRTGQVNITPANIGLGNVNNTSDANKPISTATQTALDLKVDKVSGKGLSTNDYTTTEKNKLAGIEAGANAYTHPTTSGNKHIPSGGSAGQILKWSADGSAVWGNNEGGSSSNQENRVIDYKEANIFSFNKATSSVIYNKCYLDKVEGKMYIDVTVNYSSSIFITDVTITINDSNLYPSSTGQSITWYQGGSILTTENGLGNGGGSGAPYITHRYYGSYSVIENPSDPFGGNYSSQDVLFKIGSGEGLPTADYQKFGVVRSGSTVTSNGGHTPCPIISGVPYYANTTYNVVTTSTNGLMSSTDKAKLDNILRGRLTTTSSTSMTLNTNHSYLVTMCTKSGMTHHCLIYYDGSAFKKHNLLSSGTIGCSISGTTATFSITSGSETVYINYIGF